MPPSAQKVALVTGAARGIGLATAKRFLAEGWRVALLDIEGELLRTAVATLGKPHDTLQLVCDVSDADAVARAIGELERRCWTLPRPIGTAFSPSISPAPSFAPRRLCR